VSVVRMHRGRLADVDADSPAAWAARDSHRAAAPAVPAALDLEVAEVQAPVAAFQAAVQDRVKAGAYGLLASNGAIGTDH
jgi:hypothetical protein